MSKSKIVFLFSVLVCSGLTLFAQSDKPAILIKGKSISIVEGSKTLLTIDSISFNYIASSQQSIVHNSPDSIVIQLQYKKVPEFYRINADRDYTENLIITRKDGTFHFYLNPRWARSFTIHLKDDNDHYFGLMEALYPDNRKSPDLRGQTIDVEVNGEAARLFENYATVWSSFYFNPKGYASFANTFARGRYQLAINGNTTIFHDTGKLDWYIFTGNHQKIYNSYYQVIGKPKFVPLWACGPIVWRDENNGGAAEVLDDAKKFAELKIPLTTLMVDRPYSNGGHQWSKMDFNSKFADPAIWIKTLKDTYGMEFITWIASATFTDREFPGLLPGSFGYMDLTDPSSVSEFGKRLKQHQYTNGVKGHKMDRADEQFPQGEPWRDKTPEFERRNKYVYLYTRVTDSLLKETWGKDQFTFTRAGIHGSQPYLSGIWGGDVRTSWDGMAANLANSMRVSYMGFPNWGTDATGYSGTGVIPDDLYIRWLQWSVFNGINEIKVDGGLGRGPDRVPWKYSLAVQNAFRKACEQRMEWLPHVFSQVNSSEKYGPVMKPLGMVYPEDERTHAIWDEYIFGNTLLIAPILSPDGKRSVYLPKGEWIDFNSKKELSGNQTITVEASIEAIPAYIRANSFQVRGNIYAGNQKVWNPSSEKYYADVYYYPGAGEAEFDFIDPLKNNKAVNLKAISNLNKITLSIPAISYPGMLKVYFKEKPSLVKLNKKAVKINYQDKFLLIQRKANQNLTIEISR